MAKSAPMPPDVKDESAVCTEEDLLLTRAEAEALLGSQEIQYLKIVRVCPDAILFLRRDPRGAKPRTAWLDCDDDGLSVKVEDGWPAEPAPHLMLWRRPTAQETGAASPG